MVERYCAEGNVRHESLSLLPGCLIKKFKLDLPTMHMTPKLSLLKCSSVLTFGRGNFERVSSVEGSAFFPVELTLTVESAFCTMRFSLSPVALK